MRRKFRVWFTEGDDEGEQMMTLSVTDEHSIQKMLSGENKRLIHAQPIYDVPLARPDAGPINSAGPTGREMWELRHEEALEMERERDDW